MKLTHIAFFAVLALSLIGCSSGSSGAASSSSSTEYDAEVMISFDTTELDVGEFLTVYIDITNNGPDDIDENVNILFTVYEDGEDSETIDDSPLALEIPSGETIRITYSDIEADSAGDYTFATVATFEDDTDDSNNWDSGEVTVYPAGIIAPAGTN